jgi:hypothetical protein
MLAVQLPETDLIVSRPEAGETWDTNTIHTHYFGFAVPETQIGVFAYIRYQPAFPLSQGGVMISSGSTVAKSGSSRTRAMPSTIPALTPTPMI